MQFNLQLKQLNRRVMYDASVSRCLCAWVTARRIHCIVHECNRMIDSFDWSSTLDFSLNCSYGEENGWRCEEETADYVWVLDPIDGTKSFITGNFLSWLFLLLLGQSSEISLWLCLFCNHFRETRIWYSHCSSTKWNTSKDLSYHLNAY